MHCSRDKFVSLFIERIGSTRIVRCYQGMCVLPWLVAIGVIDSTRAAAQQLQDQSVGECGTALYDGFSLDTQAPRIDGQCSSMHQVRWLDFAVALFGRVCPLRGWVGRYRAEQHVQCPASQQSLSVPGWFHLSKASIHESRHQLKPLPRRVILRRIKIGAAIGVTSFRRKIYLTNITIAD